MLHACVCWGKFSSYSLGSLLLECGWLPWGLRSYSSPILSVSLASLESRILIRYKIINLTSTHFGKHAPSTSVCQREGWRTDREHHLGFSFNSCQLFWVQDLGIWTWWSRLLVKKLIWDLWGLGRNHLCTLVPVSGSSIWAALASRARTLEWLQASS